MWRYLVFAGGGARGLAYIGFVEYLREVVDNCVGFAGTSIGAFVALACALKLTPSRLKSIAADFVRGRWYKPDVLQLKHSWGLDSGHGLQSYIEGVLVTSGFSPTVSFADLYQKTATKLVVVTVDAISGELVVFDERSTAAVAVAVRASMALMPFFGPVKLNGKLLCDGGVMCNFPLHVFPASETLGVCVAQPKERSIDTFQDFIGGVTSAVSNAMESLYLGTIRAGYTLVRIKVPSIPTMAVPMPDGTRNVLVAAGHYYGAYLAVCLGIAFIGFFRGWTVLGKKTINNAIGSS